MAPPPASLNLSRAPWVSSRRNGQETQMQFKRSWGRKEVSHRDRSATKFVYMRRGYGERQLHLAIPCSVFDLIRFNLS
jgi:hypothetical protein